MKHIHLIIALFSAAVISQPAQQSHDGLEAAELSAPQPMSDILDTNSNQTLVKRKNKCNLNLQKVKETAFSWSIHDFIHHKEHDRQKPDYDCFDWTSNGCTGVPNKPLGYNFEPSCDKHDFCYANLAMIGEFWPGKLLCDSIFYDDLIHTCRGQHPLANCPILSKTYFAGVLSLGSLWFTEDFKEPIQSPFDVETVSQRQLFPLHFSIIHDDIKDAAAKHLSPNYTAEYRFRARNAKTREFTDTIICQFLWGHASWNEDVLCSDQRYSLALGYKAGKAAEYEATIQFRANEGERFSKKFSIQPWECQFTKPEGNKTSELGKTNCVRTLIPDGGLVLNKQQRNSDTRSQCTLEKVYVDVYLGDQSGAEIWGSVGISLGVDPASLKDKEPFAYHKGPHRGENMHFALESPRSYFGQDITINDIPFFRIHTSGPRGSQTSDMIFVNDVFLTGECRGSSTTVHARESVKKWLSDFRVDIQPEQWRVGPVKWD